MPIPIQGNGGKRTSGHFSDGEQNGSSGEEEEEEFEEEEVDEGTISFLPTSLSSGSPDHAKVSLIYLFFFFFFLNLLLINSSFRLTK